MSTRRGIVAEAAVEELAATLAARFPGLPDQEIRAAARAQADDLRAAGWRITAPVTVLATRPRSRKRAATKADGAPRSTTGGA